MNFKDILGKLGRRREREETTSDSLAERTPSRAPSRTPFTLSTSRNSTQSFELNDSVPSAEEPQYTAESGQITHDITSPGVTADNGESGQYGGSNADSVGAETSVGFGRRRNRGASRRSRPAQSDSRSSQNQDDVRPSQEARSTRSSSPSPGGFFTNARDFELNSATFIQTAHVNPRISALEALKSITMPGAAFNALARNPPPKCHPGSRKELTERMHTWLADEDPSFNMLWITGPAGVGKSAIAQTFAEHCHANGRLGASLFFSRHERDDISRVIPTLVYQLALRYPTYKTSLAHILDNDPGIFEQDLSTQFKKVVQEPIQGSHMAELFNWSGPSVVILDGLDECRDRNGQIKLVELIEEYIRSDPHPHPFLWVISSRPEAYLKKVLPKADIGTPTRYVRKDLSVDDAEAIMDVSSVLRAGFNDIREHHSDMFDEAEEWPTEAQLRRLADASSGYFMFISSILKFVMDEERGDPRAQLEICLDFVDNRSTSETVNPFHALDLLYQQTLSSVHAATLPTTMRILGLWAFSTESLTVRDMMTTLNIPLYKFYAALNNLHAVLYVPPRENAGTEGLQSYHSSFPDFLRDPKRAGPFAVQKTSLTVPDPVQLFNQSPMESADDPTVNLVSETLPQQHGGPLLEDIKAESLLLEPGSSSSRPAPPVAATEREFSDSDAPEVLFTPGTSSSISNPELKRGSRSGPFPEIRGFSKKLEMSRNERLLGTLSNVLRSKQKRKALLELENERAQLMIDYLDLVLLRPNISIPWLRKHTTIVLYRLCKNTSLYPQCYVQQGIEIDALEDGGTFSDVFRGHKDEQILCVKVVRTQQKPDTDAVLRVYSKEAILWGQLDHPNITPFYGVYYLDEARKQVCLVSPWMSNGNIVEFLKGHPDIPRGPFVYDIVAGLEYLHSQSLVHSDLKGKNILVNDLGRACITDFGLSFLRTNETLTYTIGASTVRGCTYRWAAPELLTETGTPSTPESDVWAFGCVCFEVLTGSPPFPECREDAGIILSLSRGKLPSGSKPAEVLAGVDEYMCELMNRCWKADPKDRPSCQEIVNELKSKGITREPIDEALGSMGDHKRRFQVTMGKSADMAVDLTRIEEIFNELDTTPLTGHGGDES